MLLAYDPGSHSGKFQTLQVPLILQLSHAVNIDDEQGIKKRRAVFDFSDDEEVDNIISIASPETLKILHESELEACVGSMLTSCLVNPRFLQHTKKIRRRTLLTHIKELYNIVRSKDHKKDYLLFHH
ncbi:hypothetical protein ACJX0J_038236, partial [Zea mays]